MEQPDIGTIRWVVKLTGEKVLQQYLHRYRGKEIGWQAQWEDVPTVTEPEKN